MCEYFNVCNVKLHFLLCFNYFYIHTTVYSAIQLLAARVDKSLSCQCHFHVGQNFIKPYSILITFRMLLPTEPQHNCPSLLTSKYNKCRLTIRAIVIMFSRVSWNMNLVVRHPFGENISKLKNSSHLYNEKKRSEARKHCTLAVVRRSQQFRPAADPPSRGRGTTKI